MWFISIDKWTKRFDLYLYHFILQGSSGEEGRDRDMEGSQMVVERHGLEADEVIIDNTGDAFTRISQLCLNLSDGPTLIDLPHLPRCNEDRSSIDVL